MYQVGQTHIDASTPQISQNEPEAIESFQVTQQLTEGCTTKIPPGGIFSTTTLLEGNSSSCKLV